MQIIANGADHNFSSIEPHSNMQWNAMRTAYLLGIRAHGRLHGQGCIASPGRMIFVRNGRAKQGHDAVAQHLIHRAFKAVHRIHHQMNRRVQELLRRFRIEILDQLGGVFDVGKHDRHLLAFALQGLTGGEDFFREIGWCIGDRWRFCVGCWGSCRYQRR